MAPFDDVVDFVARVDGVVLIGREDVSVGQHGQTERIAHAGCEDLDIFERGVDLENRAFPFVQRVLPVARRPAGHVQRAVGAKGDGVVLMQIVGPLGAREAGDNVVIKIHDAVAVQIAQPRHGSGADVLHASVGELRIDPAARDEQVAVLVRQAERPIQHLRDDRFAHAPGIGVFHEPDNVTVLGDRAGHAAYEHFFLFGHRHAHRHQPRVRE